MIRPSINIETAHPATEVENLAAEFLDRIASGERPKRDEFLKRLASPEQRAEFQEILKFAVTVESFVPRVFEAGQMLGPYELLGELGRGGMGRVFRARDTNLDREVAIKLLKPEMQGDEIFRCRIEQEARTLARVRHPHIVCVHESGSFDGIPYLVMDLLRGKTVREVIDTLGKDPPHVLERRHLVDALALPADGSQEDLLVEGDYHRGVARIVQRVTRAIAAAHECGVLHRDLKPGNVMLCAGGNPIVMDFGLAGFRDQLAGTVTEALFGTASYLAPEQFNNLRVGSDVRTDVYQMGLILYELLALKQAFPSDSLSKIAALVTKGDFRLPHSLRRDAPPDLEAICLKAMSADPQRRYESALAMAEDLERFLKDEATIARPLNRMARLWRRARRHRPVLVNSLLAALAIASLSLAYQQIRSDRPGTHLQRVSASDRHAYPAPAGSPLQPGDQLRWDIDAESARVVWAVEWRGSSSTGPQTIAALPLIAADATERLIESQGFFVRLPEGKCRVRLLEVGPDAASQHDQLGVWLFAADKVDRVFEDWFRWLDEEQERDGQAVGFKAGLERLVQRIGTKARGGVAGPLENASDEDRRRIIAGLKADQAPDRRYWTREIKGIDCMERYFTLITVPPKESE